MDDLLQEALEIVKAQSSVRIMSEEEIISMIQNLVSGLRAFHKVVTVEEEQAAPSISPLKSIKEKSIVCLECGKSFKIITKRHLASHGLEAATYKEKWGIKRGTPLVCKGLQRERRKKMKEMKLWEKRRSQSVAETTQQNTQEAPIAYTRKSAKMPLEAPKRQSSRSRKK
jgi:predicted transcriptional regulator